jgi:DNA primase
MNPENRRWLGLVQQDLIQSRSVDLGAEDPDRPRISEDRLRGYRSEYHPYMERRGISRATAQKWGLMVETNRIGDRIVFPIRDVDGHLLAYSKRVTWDAPTCQSCGFKDPEGTSKDDATIKFGTRYNPDTDRGGCPSCKKWVWPKYQHSKGFRRNYYLYGEHLVERDHKVGVLTEGNLNPIRLDQLGVRNAVATFGSKAGNALPDAASGTPGEQLYQAAKLFREIILFADGDDAGNGWVERNSQFFRLYFPSTHTVHVVRSPAGMDPADQRLSDRDVINMLSDYDVFRT